MSPVEFIPILLIGAIMYVMLIRPQVQQKAQPHELLERVSGQDVSAALLPTFRHDQLRVELVPHVGSTVRDVWVHGAALVMFVLAASLVGVDPTAGAQFAVAATLSWASLIAALAWRRRRVHLTLRADRLVIERRTSGRRFHRREIPLDTVRAVHAVGSHHKERRGLRLALDGDELFFAAPAVPLASLEWLAEEILGVQHRAAERVAGEVPQELLEMLTEKGRRAAARDRQRRVADGSRR